MTDKQKEKKEADRLKALISDFLKKQKIKADVIEKNLDFGVHVSIDRTESLSSLRNKAKNLNYLTEIMEGFVSEFEFYYPYMSIYFVLDGKD